MGKERTKKDRIRSTPLLGGDLHNASADHAYERIRHCFLFCFYVEITCDYLNTIYGTTHDPATVIADSATHQIDEGYKNLKADEFDKSSSAPQDLSITGYSKMDAAHFNNLGLNSAFVGTLAKYAKTDPMVARLKEYCETTCGNTRLMPKAINIGPDKAVDSAQTDFKKLLFAGKAIDSPCVSIKSISTYIRLVTLRLSIYKARYKQKNQHTLVAAIRGYKHGFARAEVTTNSTGASQHGSLLRTLRDEIEWVVREVNDHLSQFTSLPSTIARTERMPGSALKDPQGLFDTRYYLDDSL
ncbi:hypothetical protein [Metapseudomonas otitidis]|uniref:hypothetical protein n=1 Tax=Metapseudomonas otitidis TaxID=319939 RepID=UPI002096C3A9|nr:hypothetical protein [Pseudomonas otitidis]MCO7552740.1 hypothetical protein [Pseudomonas otitidis]